MRINKCRISIHTTRFYAASLQQEASRQLHGVLKNQLAQRLSAWLHALQRQQPVTLDYLRLDLGTLPRAAFSVQFAPKVMAALDQALRNLHLAPEQAAPAVTADNEYQLSTAIAKAPEPPAQTQKDPPEQFLRYLQTGYWPPHKVQGNEPPAVLNHSSSPGETGYWQPSQAAQSLEQSALPNHSSSPAQAAQSLEQSALPNHSSSPGKWLTHYLRQSEQQDIPPWPGLSTVLAAPQARRRLLSCLTRQNWPLWQQRILNLPALPTGHKEKPDAITLLLLIWRQQAFDVEPTTPVISGFYQAELRLPSEPQLRELAALIARMDGKKGFAQPQIWLRRLLARHGDALWQRFTPADRQQVMAVLPDIASLPGSASPASATTARLPGSDENDASDAAPTVRENRPERPLVEPPRSVVDQHAPLPAAGEALPVHHAGLVLLWPLLPRWFSSLGLLVKTDEQAPLTFTSPQAQIEAIALLDALVWQSNDGGEWRSLLSKLLCGWPLNAPIEHWPGEERISELRLALETQLTSMLQQLQQMQLLQRLGLDKLSLNGFCQLFLQRSGTLEEGGIGWQLTVTSHPADLLLWAIPWPLEQLIYPWLPGPIAIDWQMPVFPYAV